MPPNDDCDWASYIADQCGNGSRETDIEIVHARADDMLCELLTQLGYEKTVEAYQKVPKWYA